MDKKIRAVIPAAGKGSRLNCKDTPKAMYEVMGRPLLDIVLENASFIDKKDIYIIVGYKKEKIIDYFGDEYNYVFQNEQLGTGHAVRMCESAFRDFDGTVIVTYGDMPLFRKEILEKLCEHHQKSGAHCTLLTCIDPTLTNWAHIVRDEKGRVCGIVEAADLSEEDRKSGELFAGVLVFDSKHLFETLPKLSNENAQNEYYLTEVPALFTEQGLKVETIVTDDKDDLRGINTPEDAIACERVLKKRMSHKK